ncbi:MAG: universal stress protein [Candidatus Krumholzibacteriia bacterium]
MKILVAVDFSDASESVVARASALAGPLGAEIWLIHVAEPDPDFVGFAAGPQFKRDMVAEDLHRDHAALEEMAAGIREGGIPCTPLLIQGPTVEKILAEADKLAVDLIVIGSHGKGAVKRMLFGSVSQGILQGTGVPVVVVPTRHPGR